MNNLSRESAEHLLAACEAWRKGFTHTAAGYMAEAATQETITALLAYLEKLALESPSADPALEVERLRAALSSIVAVEDTYDPREEDGGRICVDIARAALKINPTGEMK